MRSNIILTVLTAASSNWFHDSCLSGKREISLQENDRERGGVLERERPAQKQDTVNLNSSD